MYFERQCWISGDPDEKAFGHVVDFVGVVIFCGKKEDGQDGVVPFFLEQSGQGNRCRRFVCDESWTSGENGLLSGENEEGVFGKGAPTA